MVSLKLSVAGLVLSLGLWIAPAARAHIDIDAAGTHTARYSAASIKDAPCGMAGGTRSTNVHTYKPGSTITVNVTETIPHPGYFRIAFDDDGDDGFEDPSGTEGVGGNCGGDPACGPGKADYCNNETVLLDNLNATATTTAHSFSVTLPNIECDNCTLQIIQMMNDLSPFHPAPYPSDDIYYQCIDLVLSNDATDTGDAPFENDGMVCPGAPTPGDGTDTMPDAGAGGTGGTTGTGGTGGAGMDGMPMGGDMMTGTAGTDGVPMPGAAGAAGTGVTPTTPPATGTPVGGTPVAMPTSDPMPAGVAPGATQPTGSSNTDSGGCAVGGSGTGAQLGWLLVVAAVLLRRRRRGR